MTASEVVLTINTLAQLFMRQNFSALAGYFDTPVPLYTPDRVIVLKKRVWIERALMAYFGVLKNAQVVRVRPVLLDVEDTTPKRNMVLVRWEFLDAADTPVCSSTARYVLRRGDTEGRARIELIEYTEMAFPRFPKCVFDPVQPNARLVDALTLS